MWRGNANTILSAARISKTQSVRLRIRDKKKFGNYAFVITSILLHINFILYKDLHPEESASLRRLNTAITTFPLRNEKARSAVARYFEIDKSH